MYLTVLESAKLIVAVTKSFCKLYAIMSRQHNRCLVKVCYSMASSIGTNADSDNIGNLKSISTAKQLKIECTLCCLTAKCLFYQMLHSNKI